jgi:predicted Zn-dependent peptidase
MSTVFLGMIKAKTQQRLLRAALQKRGYATPSSSLDFNVTEANGFKLALQEGLSSPTSAITLAIKAGSRYEPTAGAAHALKNFVFRVSLSRCLAFRLSQFFCFGE